MFTKVFIQIFIVLFICIYKVKSQVNRTCLTPNGETSKCISIYDCKVFLDVIKTEDESQKKYLKESLCGHVREVPIVCCGSHTNYLTPPTRTKRAAEFKKNTAIPETDCGKPANDKLTGQVANDRDFPWAVRIKYSNQSKYSCEGTLISKRYVITAGLCISEKTLKRIGPISSIRLGLHNCPNKEDCEKELVDVGVDEVILHKDYGEIKSINHDDIGLIRLNQDVTFNSAISPICLQNPNESAKSGDQVIEIGWHRDSPVKLQAPITVVDKEQCTLTYKNHKIELTESHLCAAEYPNKNCAGTSGGALMKFRNGDHPAWTLEGIVSFGPVVCGGSDFPTVFTKIEPYLQWIHDNVKN